MPESMTRWFGVVVAAFALMGGAPGRAAAGLTTVEWAPDGSTDGAGTGTLGGTTVTYSSAPGSNAGATLGGQDWAAFTGTAGATAGPVTSQTAGVLGGSSTGFTQTITFSAAIDSPILLINLLDGSDVFNFGANPFTLLDSNNVTLATPLVIGSGSAADNPDDGFAVQFAGTFGPGTPLNFLFSSNGAGADGLQTVGFTVGIRAVPEPSSLVLFGFGAVGLGGYGLRRRRGGAAGPAGARFRAGPVRASGTHSKGSVLNRAL